MSAEKMTGWFRVASTNPKYPDAVAYRCSCCSVEYFFLGNEEEPRAFCCGEWKTKPKEGWLSKLPRVEAQRARGLLVLPA